MKKRVIFYDEPSRTTVATLDETSGGLFFSYNANWAGNELDPSIPLGFSGHLTAWQLDGLIDRLPIKTNPRYSEYCDKWHISPNEIDVMTLFVTLGFRTTASTICLPVGWEPAIWPDIYARNLVTRPSEG